MRLFLHLVVIVLVGCGTACSPPQTLTLTSPPPTLLSPADSTRLAPTPPPTSVFIESTPDSSLQVSGLFVFSAGDGSLILQEAAGGPPVPIVERSTESIAQMPAFTTDGSRVVYSAMLFLPDGNLRGDLRWVNLDGSQIQTTVRAQKNDEVYFYPRPAPDGRWLVTHIERLQLQGEHAQLEWIDFASGESTAVVDDARDGDVSADGTRIAFVRTETETQRTSLWLANADGTQPQEIINNQTFVAIMNPRFSPDGAWLAFTVHGATQQPLPTVGKTSECGVPLLFFCLAQTAHAHSAPGSLWRMNLETRKFQQLTNIYDDSPIAAWSRDGTQIAIHDFTGIRLIELARQQIYPLFLEDGGAGGFDWHEP